MKKLLTATAITLTLTTGALAADVRDDIRECNVYADAIANADRNARQTSRAVSNGAMILGAIIGGGSKRYAVESAVRSQGYGVSTDMQMAEMKRQTAYNQCMRDKTSKVR